MKKIVIILLFFIPLASNAHPGNTDSYGCHTCHTNCTDWGLYYGEYHCHNPKSYYVPSTPDCPLMSYYDTLSGSCKCYSGYVVEKDYLGNESCVSGDSVCSKNFGYGSEYNSLSNKCECSYGYIMDGGQCTYADTYCRNILGLFSRYNSLSDKCECTYGYVIYENKCVSEDEYCEEIFGMNTRYNSLSDQCECDIGYEFEGLKCTYKGLSSYSNLNYLSNNCPSNSFLMADGKCYCYTGYKVNDTKNGCMKIIDSTSAPITQNLLAEGSPNNVSSKWLIKNKKFAEVFYVDDAKCLHWIINEKIAEKNFGKSWNYEGNIKEFDNIKDFKFCEQLD